MRVTRVLACALAVAVWPATVIAAEPIQPVDVQIEYHAPAECPTESEFIDQVTARTTLVRVVEGNAAVRWSIALRNERGRSVGELTVVDRDGAESLRRIRAATCDEVVSAVALVAALSVDPEARAEPEPAPPKNPPRAQPPAPVVAPPAVSPSVVHYGFGEHVQWATGVSPNTHASLRLFAGVAWRSTGPSLRLSVSRMAPTVVGTEQGNAELSWWAARVEVAPLRWRPVSALAIVPSAEVEVGALHGEGVGVEVKRAETRPWIAPGLALRVEVPVYGAFRLESQATAFAPLERDRFWVGRSSTVFRAPAIGGFIAAGVAVEFP